MSISVHRDKKYSVVYPGSDTQCEDMLVQEMQGSQILSFCTSNGLDVKEVAIFEGRMVKHWEDEEDIRVR